MKCIYHKNKQTGKNICSFSHIQKPIFLVYEEVLGINKKKIETHKRKWVKDKKQCPGKEIQTAPKHMERSSTLLIIKEMQIKTENHVFIY